MSAGFEIINPTARVTGADSAAESTLKRIATVNGLRIGLLDNGMPHANDFLAHLGGALAQSYQTTLLTRRKAYTARSAELALLDEIAANCDVAVTGFGV